MFTYMVSKLHRGDPRLTETATIITNRA